MTGADQVGAAARVPEPGETVELVRPGSTVSEAETMHAPARPSWRCRECGDPWPCELWREAIKGEEGMTPTLLSITMGVYLHIAVEDGLYLVVAPEDLFARFINWTRPDSPDAGGFRLP